MSDRDNYQHQNAHYHQPPNDPSMSPLSSNEVANMSTTSSTDSKKKNKSRMLHPKGHKPYMSYPMTNMGQAPHYMPPNAAPGYIPQFSTQEGIPPGLEALIGINSAGVQQEMEAFEMFMKIEMNNRYNVTNAYMQRIYYAGEKTNFCARQCCGQNRPFLLNLYDGMGEIVVTVERFCNCCLCCFGGTTGGSDVTVRSAVTGELLGKVVQNWSYCTPSYNILDGDCELAMRIRGPCCGSYCGICFKCDAAFAIFFAGKNFDDGELKDTQAGVITKKFGIQELAQTPSGNSSDATNFIMTFPPDLHPSLKAVLIAAVFCIDFSYFEEGGGRCSSCSGCRVFIVLIIIAIIVIAGILLYNHFKAK